MKLLIPVSYMGSGSSAFTDLLHEFPQVRVPQGTFEYVFLHCPNGLFDLEDKLLKGNTALRSDEALHSFENCMKKLYQGRWWVGHYKERLTPHFLEYCQTFLDTLIEVRPDFYWYQQEQYSFKNYPYLTIRSILRKISLGKIDLPRPLTHHPMYLSWPSKEKFYTEAQKWIAQVLNPLLEKDSYLLLDQLLLPHNLHRFPNYFTSPDVHVLLVQRDPRDMFLSNKYVWAHSGEPVPYPTDVEAFCSMFRNLKTAEKKIEHPQIHKFFFEDLIYHYEESCQTLSKILQLPEVPKLSKTYFHPGRSWRNTQLYKRHPEWAAEASIIEKKLPEFLYHCPYGIEDNPYWDEKVGTGGIF